MKIKAVAVWDTVGKMVLVKVLVLLKYRLMVLLSRVSGYPESLLARPSAMVFSDK